MSDQVELSNSEKIADLSAAQSRGEDVDQNDIDVLIDARTAVTEEQSLEAIETDDTRYDIDDNFGRTYGGEVPANKVTERKLPNVNDEDDAGVTIVTRVR